MRHFPQLLTTRAAAPFFRSAAAFLVAFDFLSEEERSEGEPSEEENDGGEDGEDNDELGDSDEVRAQPVPAPRAARRAGTARGLTPGRDG